jgi:NADH-quinone oxidoreductase subunit M
VTHLLGGPKNPTAAVEQQQAPVTAGKPTAAIAAILSPSSSEQAAAR